MLAVGRVDPLEVIWLIESFAALVFCFFCLRYALADYRDVVESGTNSAALIQVQSDRRIAFLHTLVAAGFVVLGLFSVSRVPNPDAVKTGTQWITLFILMSGNAVLAYIAYDKWRTRVKVLAIYRNKREYDAAHQLESGGGVGDRRDADTTSGPTEGGGD